MRPGSGGLWPSWMEHPHFLEPALARERRERERHDGGAQRGIHGHRIGGGAFDLDAHLPAAGATVVDASTVNDPPPFLSPFTKVPLPVQGPVSVAPAGVAGTISAVPANATAASPQPIRRRTLIAPPSTTTSRPRVHARRRRTSDSP